MSTDCVSSAGERVKEKPRVKSITDAEPRIVFIEWLLVFCGSCSVKFAILLCCFDVAPSPPGNVLLFLHSKLSTDFRRRSEYERARGNFRPDGDKSVCADDRTRADFHIVKNDSAHPNEHFIVDFACVHDGGVTNRNQFAHDCWIICVDVNDGIILDIRSRADDDAIDIATKHGAIPDT